MPLVLVGALCGAVGFALGRELPRDEPVASTSITAEEHAHANAGAAALPADVPEDPMAVDPPPSPAAPEASVEGTLRDHVDVAQYTYLHLALEAGDTWAAVYKAPVKDGAHVIVEHAARLQGFHSRELNRDFPEIWFGSLAKAL